MQILNFKQPACIFADVNHNLETQKHTKWIEIQQSQFTIYDLSNLLK